MGAGKTTTILYLAGVPIVKRDKKSAIKLSEQKVPAQEAQQEEKKQKEPANVNSK